MLFNSWPFFLFFPAVTALYFLFPHRWRWLLLLSASCFFYMSFIPVYILILVTTIIVDYSAAIWIEASQGRARSIYLASSIAATCLILFFFKYYDFFAMNVTGIAHFLGWNYSLDTLKLILPIGLSFHTFQSLSYVIEVYRGNQKAERHFGIYALYVMFYPQLVSGPIERPQNLLHQFREKHEFDYRQATDGLKLMAWGLFQKVVIADRLARFVNPVYDHPRNYSGLIFVVTTVFFAFEILCDFSGYTDIARGAAQVMGFRLMENFDRPYSSKTLSEFWKRWHISLSTWLRDYIYEPITLKYRSSGTGAIITALLVTFLTSGFWHGAAWTFVIWGLLHGVMLCWEVLTAKVRKRLAKIVPAFLFNGISVLFTFSFVSFTYIFFRARTLSDAFYIITHMTEKISFFKSYITDNILRFYPPVTGIWQSITTEFDFCIGLIFLLIGVDVFRSRIRLREFIAKQPFWTRFIVYQTAIGALVFLGVWFEKRQFIYFQF